MNITINTDASYSHKHEIGSYAFYIISNLGRIQMSGKLRKKCTRPEVAEIMCIFNALHVVANTPDLIQKSKLLIINTDCMNAIHILTRDNDAIRRYRLGMMTGYYTTYTQKVLPIFKGKVIEFRHVKSHSGVNDKRSYVNEWCDSAAKVQIAEYKAEREKIFEANLLKQKKK